MGKYKLQSITISCLFILKGFVTYICILCCTIIAKGNVFSIQRITIYILTTLKQRTYDVIISKAITCLFKQPYIQIHVHKFHWEFELTVLSPRKRYIKIQYFITDKPLECKHCYLLLFQQWDNIIYPFNKNGIFTVWKYEDIWNHLKLIFYSNITN